MKFESLKELIDIVITLRSDNGCEWDKKQTPESLTPHLIEETYEVVDAILDNNTENLKEELGDLLLHIIFQAVINMAVATNLFPVTGQTLPLISSGGTSIWMTCFALGMILSVSSSKQETEETILDDNPLDILHEAID